MPPTNRLNQRQKLLTAENHPSPTNWQNWQFLTAEMAGLQDLAYLISTTSAMVIMRTWQKMRWIFLSLVFDLPPGHAWRDPGVSPGLTPTTFFFVLCLFSYSCCFLTVMLSSVSFLLPPQRRFDNLGNGGRGNQQHGYLVYCTGSKGLRGGLAGSARDW